MSSRCTCLGCRLFHEIVLLVLFLLMSGLVGCHTYQVLDGRRVPRHPRPDSAATFPTR